MEMESHMHRLKRIVFFAVFAWIGTVKAQVDDFSPFSIYGIGEWQRPFAQHGSVMGQTGAALRDSMSLSFLNPASISAVDLVTLQVGTEINSGSRTIGNSTYSFGNLFVNNFSLGLPVVRKTRGFQYSMALSFSPFSQIGYSMRDSSALISNGDTIPVERAFNGSGGWNRLSWYHGIVLFRRFSLGAGFHYTFGSLTRDRNLILPSNQGFFSTRNREEVEAGSFSYDLGIQHRFELNFKRFVTNTKGRVDTIRKHQELVLGISYQPSMPITASRMQLGMQYVAGAYNIVGDTIQLSQESGAAVQMPGVIRAGLQWSNPGKWLWVADAHFSSGSQFRYFNDPSGLYADAWGIGSGFQCQPGNWKKKPSGSVFSKNTIARLGLHYQINTFQPEKFPVTEFGMGIGLGLPFNHGFRRGRNMGQSKYLGSYLNLGAQVLLVGSEAPGTYRELFFRITLGVSLRDWWFDQPRFN
ncbi:MAG: hypothetical protein FJZ75_03665 [Bacteroidetes bacterium]|nr:hypothetical protein [Bacteroidota bacterium]